VLTEQHCQELSLIAPEVMNRIWGFRGD